MQSTRARCCRHCRRRSAPKGAVGCGVLSEARRHRLLSVHCDGVRVGGAGEVSGPRVERPARCQAPRSTPPVILVVVGLVRVLDDRPLARRVDGQREGRGATAGVESARSPPDQSSKAVPPADSNATPTACVSSLFVAETTRNPMMYRDRGSCEASGTMFRDGPLGTFRYGLNPSEGPTCRELPVCGTATVSCIG